MISNIVLLNLNKNYPQQGICLDNDDVDDAISRAYYAVFHSAKALLQYVGIETKSHEGLKQMFGLHLVEPGLVERKMGRILNNLKEDRENGDYALITYFDKKDAQDVIKKAEFFMKNTIAFFKAKGFVFP